MAESALAVLAVILMLVAIVASVLPVVPGPALVWAIGLTFAALTGFGPVGWFPLSIMTLLMILGTTSGWWMQAAGMHAQGGSCMSIIGALIGGLVGTFAIPVPFLGTLAGIVIGTLIFEYARVGEFQQAMKSGGSAVRGYLLGIIVETGLSIVILIVFALSLLL